jgi:hypothetical protein
LFFFLVRAAFLADWQYILESNWQRFKIESRIRDKERLTAAGFLGEEEAFLACD